MKEMRSNSCPCGISSEQFIVSSCVCHFFGRGTVSWRHEKQEKSKGENEQTPGYEDGGRV